MIKPNVWKNKECSRPPTSMVGIWENRLANMNTYFIWWWIWFPGWQNIGFRLIQPRRPYMYEWRSWLNSLILSRMECCNQPLNMFKTTFWTKIGQFQHGWSMINKNSYKRWSVAVDLYSITFLWLISLRDITLQVCLSSFLWKPKGVLAGNTILAQTNNMDIVNDVAIHPTK